MGGKRAGTTKMNESRDKLKGLRAGANGRDDSKNKWKGSE
jgi:hypothetical protein